MTTKERVQEMVGERGMTPRETALILGVSTQRVYQLMRKLGIEPPTKKEEGAA